MASSPRQAESNLTTIADPRARAMYERYSAGASLQDVADEVGLTREGVRQIFLSSGLPTRPQGATAKLKRARRRSESADQICAAFIGSDDPVQIARNLVIPESLVREILREHMPFAYRHRGRRRPQRYSDTELLSFLRSAAPHCPTPLSTNTYRAFAAGRRAEGGRPWPAPQTIAARFVRWRLALVEAGLPAGEPTARGRKQRFDRESCKRSLQIAAAKLGSVPGAPEYGVMARASGGRLPSYKTVRRHFDSWVEALREADLLDENGGFRGTTPRVLRDPEKLARVA